MKKQCQFVLLPINNPNPTQGDIGILGDKLVIVDTADAGFPHEKFIPQHLHILSDDEIKESDWVIIENTNKQLQLCKIKLLFEDNCCAVIANEDNEVKFGGISIFSCKKIIATTNPELWVSSSNIVYAISQLDIEYIISLYNGKSKEVDVERLIIEKAQQYAIDSHSNNRTSRDIGYRDGYNQCLQDNADKKFSEGDMRKLAFKVASGCTIREIDEFIDSCSKEQPKSDIIVEYIDSADIDPNVEYNQLIPKVKDGCIVIVRN